MKKFTKQDISDYYSHTENHYKLWWKIEENLGLHYGIWEKDTKTLSDAVINNNVILSKIGEIKQTDFVLDAGCGVGGTSIFLAKKIGCKTNGITLNNKQVESATNYAKKNNVSNLTSFKLMDYTATEFADNTFDFVINMESLHYANDKNVYLKELMRILKPKGKFIVCDVFKSNNVKFNDSKLLQLMFNPWAISEAISFEDLVQIANQNNFSLVNMRDVTKEVYPSVKRLFIAGYFGMYATFLYNIFIKKATYFSRIHYKSSLAQLFAYKKKLWNYKVAVFQAND